MKTFITYIGRRWNQRKISYTFLDESGDTISFATPRNFVPSVGNLYQVEVDGTTYSNWEFQGKAEEQIPGLITKWSVLDKEANQAKLRFQDSKKKHTNDIENLISVVKLSMKHQTARSKADIALYVFRELTR